MYVRICVVLTFTESNQHILATLNKTNTGQLLKATFEYTLIISACNVKCYLESAEVSKVTPYLLKVC